MTHTEPGLSFWDRRYLEEGWAYGTRPNAWLAAQARRLPQGGRALVPAAGEGRDAVWLATQGLDVLAVDLSAVGLRKAEHLAAARGVTIQTSVVDLAEWTWPERAFDVVVASFVHLPPGVRAPVHAAMADALAPGGGLVIEAFAPRQLEYRERYGSGGPPDEEMLYAADTLARDFRTLKAVELEETEVVLEEGRYHDGPAFVTRGVFVRDA